MEKELEIQEIKGFIRRRKKAFIISFLSILILGACIALSLTPIYSSKAMIRIEDQQIPENYVESTITDYAEQRIDKISQEILSRPKLLEIIDRFNLYPQLKDKNSPTELVKKINKGWCSDKDSFKEILDIHNPDVVGEKYITLYNSLISRK